MALCRDNKSRIILSPKFLALCILFWMLYPNKASSGPYLDSAHGNTSYGINRSGLSTLGYSIGNCAHCHEQHASIGGAEPVPNSPAGPDYYLLFMDLWVAPPQSNEFCFGCHIGTGSYQSSWGRTPDFACYSYRAGGDTSLTCPASVYESFQFVSNAGVSQSNCGSSVGTSHLIPDIGTFMAGKVGFPSTYAYLNPCDACHNPHRAKRAYPCSRPSAHASLPTWNVWGDDSTEKMDYYSSNNYWAPKKLGGGYEPDGTSTQDGSNMPNYVSLCTDCHNSTNLIWSTRLGKNLRRVDWSGFGDFHGGRARIDNGGDFSGIGEYGDLSEPYKVGGSYSKVNYVLSCTDCHEPHGSPNEYLLRPTLNGYQANAANGGPISGGKWYYFCTACHSFTGHPTGIGPGTNCYQGGACHKHCDVGACSAMNSF